GQGFQTLEMEDAAVQFVRSGFGDYVDKTSGAASELCARTRGNNLEFLDRLHRNIDRRPLTADLFAEKSIVVIAAIEIDIIEYSTLAGEIDLIAVRPLGNGNAGSQGQQILKLTAQNGRIFDCDFIERAARFGLDDIDCRRRSNGDCLLNC